jgi:hypothetical protein
MPLTRKFSQFVAQNVTSVVGLTGGANSIGPNSGGGGGAVTQVIIQANTFTIGQWIRFDVASNMYVLAQATTPLAAEVIGVVIVASPTQFTLQQSGYITTAQGIYAGLIPGQPQFLDDAVPGNMINVDVLIDGEVSRPVFIPDTPTSGWVLPYRGIIVGGGPDTGGGGGTTPTDTSIVTVVQNGHGFNPGDWVRVETPTVGPNQVHYVKAIATTLANSQAVGVVIEVINANQFKLQFSGYIATDGTVFAPFQDDAAALLVPKIVYYLSSTVAGELTAVDPSIASAGFSKPLYIPEQTVGTVNRNAGYILPQRPLNPYVANPNSSPWIFLGILNDANGFSSDTILTGPYHAYWIIFNSTLGAPLQSTNGGAPSGFGLQIRSAGVWSVGPGSAYMDGVNSTAGVNTATWWGYVRNTIGPASMLLAPPLVNQPELGFGFCLLTSNNGFGNISGEIDFANYGVVPNIGYTCDFSSAIGIVAAAQGLRLVIEGPGALIPGSGFYITVYGVPNS